MKLSWKQQNAEIEENILDCSRKVFHRKFQQVFQTNLVHHTVKSQRKNIQTAILFRGKEGGGGGVAFKGIRLRDKMYSHYPGTLRPTEYDQTNLKNFTTKSWNPIFVLVFLFNFFFLIRNQLTLATFQRRFIINSCLSVFISIYSVTCSFYT